MEADDMDEAGDENYFASYEDLEVHRLMLTDRPRTEAYKHAILSSKSVFKDKIVMDVGAGTGILSFFCAQAGAKKVYAVEASGIARILQKVIEANKLSEIIEVLNNRVEDVILPDNEKVDVIVSEWMGFYLLHEGMLDSVLIARDTHLKPGGKLFPDKAKLYACPCSVPDVYGFWNDVYGMDMSLFGKEIRKSKSSEPQVMTISQDDLLSKYVCILELDLVSVTSKELDEVSSKHVVCMSKNGMYEGLCVWFDCFFPTEEEDSLPGISTAPSLPPTHWKQTVIVLPQSFSVEEGEPIAWQIDLSRSSSNQRHYCIQFNMLDAETEKHPIPCYCHMTKCIVVRTFLECETEKTQSEEDMFENEIIDLTEN